MSYVHHVLVLDIICINFGAVCILLKNKIITKSKIKLSLNKSTCRNTDLSFNFIRKNT